MKKVLIIDDAATVRMYHRNILQQAGFSTEEAINGLEALEKAHTNHFDLYLVDVNMPKMDGYTFIRKLRESTEIEQAPAVMISTEAEAEDEVKAYLAGANLYLIKPIRPEQLLEFASLLVGGVA
ncbi:two-component system chemotaxis response regulator CheY [Limnobacter thiooxidans]|uniref:Response regulator n=1 Tax=Limnobacter thiooxidans TaxID=131080 RepID=A0AA86J0X7_9BURK|nr:two-component system chemotaxis response regulator CheY [Limnobacter thiooxidans]BET27033.1 response regulator [Limnobacter thiooxidans]